MSSRKKKDEKKTKAAHGRILAVDDEPMVLSVLTRMLRGEHDLVTADSGAGARAILENDTAFDVVLCDIMMPDISGIDLHDWLEAKDPDMAKRMVFVTGGTFTARSVEFFKRVGNPTLEKPFNHKAVKALVQSLVTKEKR